VPSVSRSSSPGNGLGCSESPILRRKVASFIGKGRSVGFGGFGGGGQVTLFGKAPDQRTLIIDYVHDRAARSTTRSYNGSVGWLRTPLTVLGEYHLRGGELGGRQTECSTVIRETTSISELPGPSSQTSVQGSNVMVGQDRSVDVVHGTGPGLVTTLYFAKDTCLLLREVRYGRTPIGRVPTEIDYADYRRRGRNKVPNFALHLLGSMGVTRSN
jgi:hypothetical protein